MKIRRIEVDDILDRGASFSADFHEDINVITGKNGAGKTTILKLIWYISSGNIYQALAEVPFQRCRVLTDAYDCTVIRLRANVCKVIIVRDGVESVYEDLENDEGEIVADAEDLANDDLMDIGSSVFFPTFRRIEGGFTLNVRRRTPSGRLLSSSNSRSRGEIEDSLSALMKRLTNHEHQFVASISTVDVDNVVLSKFADLSTMSDEMQTNVSTGIIAQIKNYLTITSESKEASAYQVLNSIKISIEDMESYRERVMSPLNAINLLVAKIFKNNSILFSSRLTFGEAASAISSDLLSAGEKQMLSFLCYNALFSSSIMFIDEPELSLHADWQRILFPTLLKQQGTNQFIIATHSPFIYTKYLDKEIRVTTDRGNEQDTR